MTEQARQQKPRSALLAGLLSLPFPGTGLLYAGRPGAALAIAGALTILPAARIALIPFLPPSWVALTIWEILIAGVILWIVQVVASVRVARRAGSDWKLRPYNRAVVYVGFAVGWMGINNVVSLSVRRWVAEQFTVSSESGESMWPTLLAGDRFWTVKVGPRARIDRGSVVTYRPYGDELVFAMRVIGMGGDSIRIADDEVLVNQQRITAGACDAPPSASCMRESFSGDRAWSAFYERPRSGPPFETVVPSGHVFILGDNRAVAADSVMLGPVPLENVTGRAVVVWLSFDPDTWEFRWDRIGVEL